MTGAARAVKIWGGRGLCSVASDKRMQIPHNSPQNECKKRRPKQSYIDEKNGDFVTRSAN
jgi:hypothetical protein